VYTSPLDDCRSVADIESVGVGVILGDRIRRTDDPASRTTP
jgi:hypothetical protein